MKWLVLLPVLLCLSPAAAEEELGPRCGLYAVVDEGDAGMRKIYDGLRKGLELAHLPRVCREAQPETQVERDRFLERLATEKRSPLFVIGDAAAKDLSAPMPRITRVFALERYTAGGRPLRDLPVVDRSALVYAARPAERVGEILRGLTGGKQVVALLPRAQEADVESKAVARFLKATGVAVAGAGQKPQVVLHLRLPFPGGHASFADALALARKRRVPLVSDDRARFGQGAVVTLVGRHDLVGKAAAECGRRLRATPDVKIPPYGLPGVEVWVDLGAADAQGLEPPLPFLARADRLKRAPAGRRRPAR